MGKFENSWKEFFEEAEVNPSPLVWTNIDRDLTLEEGKSMKRSLIFYQRLAAASVLFALLVGSFAVHRWRADDQLAHSNKVENKLPSVTNDRPTSDKKNNSNDLAKENLAGKNQLPPVNSKPSQNFDQVQSNEHGKKLLDEEHGNRSKAIASFTSATKKTPERLLADISSAPDNLPIPEIHSAPARVDIVRKLPAMPAAFMIHQEKKINHEQLWAAVTTAAGSYNSNTNAYSNYNYGYSQNTSGGSGAVGTSYSFGMLGGIRLTNRFVLQSGFQYLNQSINSVSNIGSTNSLSAVSKYVSTSATPNIYNLSNGLTSPYSISSANELLSVPVQAGYLIMNRKVGLQVNSGVSSDFFIRNTLSDPSGQRQSYSQGSGQDSPYRAVNFSGLLNSEVSYKFGSRYRVSLVPGFRYSFSPVLKSNVNVTGNPWVLDVGFRFRYIFK